MRRHQTSVVRIVSQERGSSFRKHSLEFSPKAVAVAGGLGVLLPVFLSGSIAWAAFFPGGGFLPAFGFLSQIGAVLLAVGAAFGVFSQIGTMLLTIGAVCWVFLGGVAFSLLSLTWRPAALSIVIVAGMAVGFVPGMIAFMYLKQAGYALLGWRSASLVEAIKAYERTNGAPPRILDDLTPGYLAEIPRTGMAAYPEYEYAAEAGPCLADNAWHLKVDAGEILQWDFFFYCPKQVYTEEGWGGYNEVIGDWAYLHE